MIPDTAKYNFGILTNGTFFKTNLSFYLFMPLHPHIQMIIPVGFSIPIKLNYFDPWEELNLSLDEII